MRVIVAGTNFGAFYLRALTLWRGEGFELIGILARGSKRSLRVSSSLKVPLYNRIDDVPADADILCVALPPHDAAKVASDFLKSGRHVLFEHPVHSSLLYKLYDVAQANDSVIHVHGHYADLPAVNCFCEHFWRQGSELRHLRVETNKRSLFSMLDLLRRFLGAIAPLEVEPEDVQANPVAFEAYRPRCLTLGLPKGHPVFLEVHPDSDSDGVGMCITHRIFAMFRDLNLILLNPAGPVIESTHPCDELAKVDAPMWQIRWPPPGASAPSWRSFALHDRTLAILVALKRLRRHIEKGHADPEQSSHHWIEIADTWEKINRYL